MNRERGKRDKNSPVSPTEAQDESLTLDPNELFASYRKSRSVDLAARIYDLTAARLRIYAATLLSDPNDVDDAVQDTFVAAFERPETWRSDRPFLPWLAGILRNRVLNRFRTERRRKSRESDADDQPNEPADPLERMGAAEVVRAVENGIAGLPSTYRLVVANRVFDGASSAEIARELGRTENTVRVQLSRGLQMLRDTLPIGIGAALAIALVPASASAASTSAGIGAKIGAAVRHGVRRRTAVRAGLLATAAAIPLAAWAALSGGDSAPLEPATPTELVVLIADDDTANAAHVPSVPTTIERVTVANPSPANLDIELVLDGRPAAGAPISIERVDGASLFAMVVTDRYGRHREFEVAGAARSTRRHARTDGDGAVRFEPGAGRFLVRVPGNGAILELGPEIHRKVRFDLSGSAAVVRCAVVDETGQACPAEIWASGWSDGEASSRLASTDATGTFASVLPAGAVIQARVGTRASAPIRVTAETPDLLLALAPAGGVRGVVRGTGGHPVPGALVELEGRTCPLRVRADADGRFEIPGVASGDWWLTARGGTAPVSVGRTRLSVQNGSEADVTLELVETATIVGQVTDALGVPIAGTRVRAGWSSGHLDSVVAATDENGRFELTGVPPRAVRIGAGLGSDGFAQESITPAAGQRLTWNPILSPDDLRIAGVIEAAARAPDLVVALDADDHFHPVAQQIEDGGFAVDVPAFGAGRVFTARIYRADTLEALGIRRSFPVAVFPGVIAGDQDLSWKIGTDVEQTGEVRTRVVARAQTYTGRVRLVNLDQQHWIEVGRVTADSRRIDVHAERLPAGRYALALDQGFDQFEFQLSPGESLDLGDVLLPDSTESQEARIAIQLVFEHPGDATPMDRLQTVVTSLDGRRLASIGGTGQAGVWRQDTRLPAGPAKLVARTANGLVAEIEITISEDGPSTLHIPLRRTTPGK